MSGDDLERRARARVGKVLDEKYLLERLIGVGGMAAVYAARHRNGSRAAVKLLHPEIARDEEIRGRFLSEGYAANRVEHPGAVRVVDDDVVREGDDKGTAYLVMELLEGESVYARAKKSGTLGEAEVLSIAEGVLDVLEHAHSRGIVHRDLKPDNLFLVKHEDRRERVKVLDFGIARIADGARRTNAGQTLGTPSYMSPEQAKGHRDLVDGRSDLFSLGATMFRLLTGRRIHDADSPTEILVKMSTLPAPPIRTVAPALSEGVAAIVDRALAFERGARYPDAAAMRADVRAVRSGAPAIAPIAAGFVSGSDATGILTAPPAAPEAPTIAALAPSPAAASVVLDAPAPTIAPTELAREPLPPTASHSAAALLPPTIARPAPPSRRNVALIVGAGAAFVVIVAVALFVVFGRTTPRADGFGRGGTEEDEQPKKSLTPVEEKEGDPRDTPSADIPAEETKPKPTAPVVAKPIPKVTSQPVAKPAPAPATPSSPPGKSKGNKGKNK